MTTVTELESALEAKGWEPDYRETDHLGEDLPHPVFEVGIGNRIVSVELSDLEDNNEIVFARVWEYDEDEETILEVWDIEDVSSPESIIEDVELFIQSE